MNVAMIGSGGIAHRHLQVLSREKSIEVVGHVARTARSGEAAAQTWGGRAYESCDELLEHEQVDAAWITVPPNAHGAIEECLVQYGVPFFVEKPLSADRATGERIAGMLEHHNVIAGVGYHWRALDFLPEVRDALSRHPARMVIAAWHDRTPPPRWWHHQKESGGQMVEQATHLFDLARHLVGEASVVATSTVPYSSSQFEGVDVPGASAALLRYDSGAIGSFTATCILSRPSGIYLQFICDGLAITVTQSGAVFDTQFEQREVRVRADPFSVEDRAFLEAVRTGDASHLLCNYEDALGTHHLTFDVQEMATR